MTRKEAREQAFVLIFEKGFKEEPMTQIIEDAVADRLIEQNDYADDAAIGVYEHLAEVDAQIRANLKSWSLDRVSRVALAAMRLCVYEMYFVPEIPASVSINEAVEIAKKFATTEDAAYINGVLGSIAKAMDGGEADAHA